MAVETSDSGVSASIPSMSRVAADLQGHSATLHGHANALAGATVPVAAFGASAAAGAEWERARAALEQLVRGHATQVAAHGDHVSASSASAQGVDGSGASAVSALSNRMSA